MSALAGHSVISGLGQLDASAAASSRVRRDACVHSGLVNVLAAQVGRQGRGSTDPRRALLSTRSPVSLPAPISARHAAHSAQCGMGTGCHDWCGYRFDGALLGGRYRCLVVVWLGRWRYVSDVQPYDASCREHRELGAECVRVPFVVVRCSGPLSSISRSAFSIALVPNDTSPPSTYVPSSRATPTSRRQPPQSPQAER